MRQTYEEGYRSIAIVFMHGYRFPEHERRTAQQVNPANPRDKNRYGHIIEIMPPVVNGRPDHTATTCR